MALQRVRCPEAATACYHRDASVFKHVQRSMVQALHVLSMLGKRWDWRYLVWQRLRMHSRWSESCRSDDFHLMNIGALQDQSNEPSHASSFLCPLENSSSMCSVLEILLRTLLASRSTSTANGRISTSSFLSIARHNATRQPVTESSPASD